MAAPSIPPFLPSSLPLSLPTRPPRSCWELDAGTGAGVAPRRREGRPPPAEGSFRSRGVAPGPGGGGASAPPRAGWRLRFPPRGAAAVLALGAVVSVGYPCTP